MRFALALLLLALPAAAQTTRTHRVGGAVYPGGPGETLHRLRKGPGTSGSGPSAGGASRLLSNPVSVFSL